MTVTQLRLPFAHAVEIDVQCPHCGHQFDALKVVLAGLPAATREVWEAGEAPWQKGRVLMGPSDLADRVGKSESTVRYHLSLLVAAGLVRRVPQNKYRRVRHLYTGTIAI